MSDQLFKKFKPVLPHLKTKFALTHILGVEITTSQQETDYEIAKAAKDHDAIGILANDSDYLIYQTGVPLLSVNDLKDTKNKSL